MDAAQRVSGVSCTREVAVHPRKDLTVTLLAVPAVHVPGAAALADRLADVKPDALAVPMSRRTAMLTFPGQWLRFRPPPVSQTLSPEWPGFLALAQRALQSQLNAALRSALPGACASPATAAVHCALAADVPVFTVGPSDAAAAVGVHSALPPHLAALAEHTSPAQVWRALAFANRRALAGMVQAAGQAHLHKLRQQPSRHPALPSCEAVLEVLPAVIAGGRGAPPPPALAQLARHLQRAVNALESGPGAPVPHERHVTALAGDLLSCSGHVVCTVAPGTLPALARALESPVHSAQHMQACTVPASWRWRHTLVPAAACSGVLGLLAGAVALRRTSRLARAVLWTTALCLPPGVGVGVLVPFAVHAKLCEDVARAAELGRQFAEDPAALYEAEEVYAAHAGGR